MKDETDPCRNARAGITLQIAACPLASRSLFSLPMTILTGPTQHKNRQLKAVALLVVACFVMLICLTQRASILHHMQVKAAALSLTADNSPQELTSPGLSPCELSAHSLLSAQPLHFDTILLLPGLLVLVLAVLLKISVLPRPVIFFRPPLLRIHLKNCVFRE
ncbi:copper-binding protein [Leclercia adecarboxylata]|uniref:copper-binding protein n=1 Tax=Leclercia adecarboxylata TaxID=83655 RepID=UPI0033058D61